MKCPKCSGQCIRDEVDIGVGIQYGPWRCDDCGWGEPIAYPDLLNDDEFSENSGT